MSIPGLWPAPSPRGDASYRYSDIVIFPPSMPLLVRRTTFPPKGGTETLLPLTAYLKLAMLYDLCIAPSLLITHYSLLIAFQMP